MKSPSDVHELIRLAISDVTPQAKKRELTVNTAIADDVQPITVDADKIRRVLVNLLGNAVKFTQPGGKVTVRASMHEDKPVGSDRFDVFEPERNTYLRVDVIDTGIGIATDKIERIFDSFFQVDNSSAPANSAAPASASPLPATSSSPIQGKVSVEHAWQRQHVHLHESVRRRRCAGRRQPILWTGCRRRRAGADR